MSPDADRHKYGMPEYRSKVRDPDFERYRESSPRDRYKEIRYRERAREEAYAYEQYRSKKSEARDPKYREAFGDEYDRHHHRYSDEEPSLEDYRRSSLQDYEKAAGLRRYRSSLDAYAAEREDRRLKADQHYD